MRKTPAGLIAFGGMMAALALVIMCLGTLIPAATFVCPMLCCLILQFLLAITGNRIGWSWYIAVSLLSVLLAPDKEAAATFIFLGYYPIIKPKMDKLILPWLWKALLFNAVILLMYQMLIHLFGMVQLAEDFAELGLVLEIVMLLLGNVTFFMLDLLLGKRLIRRKRG